MPINKKKITVAKVPREKKVVQTASQYNRELMRLCELSGKDAITVEFLRTVQPILQRQGGIAFNKEQVASINKKRYGKA